MEKITVTINSYGVAKVHIEGIHGPRCSETVEHLSSHLGPVSLRTETSEYYEQEITTQVDQHTRVTPH
ncbi:MAG TPA: DUF2997 domain-containing protein [Spirochaetota bacterium]|nr:DUF2997 domain-containing protein [Spirochaetota bacterium]